MSDYKPTQKLTKTLIRTSGTFRRGREGSNFEVLHTHLLLLLVLIIQKSLYDLNFCMSVGASSARQLSQNFFFIYDVIVKQKIKKRPSAGPVQVDN
jgi:hypothetical protein